MKLTRINYSSGAPLEEEAGYSRVVKAGPFVYVGDAYAQTKYVLDKQVKLLKKAGAKPEEVVKVKAYTTDMSLSSEIGKAYGGRNVTI